MPHSHGHVSSSSDELRILQHSPRPTPARFTEDAPILLQGCRYSDVRKTFVVIEHDPSTSSLTALLRFEGAVGEENPPRAELRALGFLPDAAPLHAPLSFRLKLRSEEEQLYILQDITARAHRVFGKHSLVLDVGASFPHDQGRKALQNARLAAARFWPGDGRFLIHVGGTNRCVVWLGDANRVTARALEEKLGSLRADYECAELRSPTE